jgi:hypothetical protein
MTYRVVLADNPNVSPFPSHVWPTRELAEKFCESEEAGQWRGKLKCVESEDRRMSEKTLCVLCGEPMPEGEEMFNYHGYSGPCPNPPLNKPSAAQGTSAVVTLAYNDSVWSCSRCGPSMKVPCRHWRATFPNICAAVTPAPLEASDRERVAPTFREWFRNSKHFDDRVWDVYAMNFASDAYAAGLAVREARKEALEQARSLLEVAEWAVYALENGSSVEVHWLNTVAKEKHKWAREVIANLRALAGSEQGEKADG